MRKEQLPGFDLPELAAWPLLNYETMSWVMHILKLRDDNTLHWYRHYIERPERVGVVFADVYEDYSIATKSAMELNDVLITNIDRLELSLSERESLYLKVDKALTSKSRLINEEQLMLEVAMRKHSNQALIKPEDITVDPFKDNVRIALFSILSKTPYLQIAYIPTYRLFLSRKDNNVWVQSTMYGQKAAKACYQERIARGFGLSGLSHWGKTKAAIRMMLLPRANQLLQLASVKRMLTEAEVKGNKVLIIDGFVFWFEEKNQVGWVVKVASDSKATSKGNTLWKEGKITSKNHGRIVVLPYIKESGEYVHGHTKNAPNDGKAMPRHKDEYVELPFEILNGDIMRGLFGELYYE